MEEGLESVLHSTRGCSVHGFEWIFLKRSVGMKIRKNFCCYKGSSDGSRIGVCVRVFLGTGYIINCYLWKMIKIFK